MQHLSETHHDSRNTVDVFLLSKDDDHYGNKDCTFQKFHSFLDRPSPDRPDETDSGWAIDDDYLLTPRSGSLLTEDDPFFRLGDVLQAWLFFGLLYTIVQDERGEPLLTFHDLVKFGQNTTLDTGPSPPTKKGLNVALYEWRQSIRRMASEKGGRRRAKIQMIRVEMVLRLAKRVVTRNCAAVSGPPPYSDESSDQRFVGDNLALCLMVLGETLTSAKAHMMETERLDIPGWHSEDADDGWGPSQKVISFMEDINWCPRTRHILRSQFKSHATLMYGAYLSHRESKRAKEHRNRQGEECTESECKLKSNLPTTDEYRTGHVGSCSNCEWVGPNVGDILRILERSDIRNGDDIPVLLMSKRPGGTIDLSVESRRPSERTMDYATISHVWSDGWGNEKANQLHACQLRFLFDTLTKSPELPPSPSDPGSSKTQHRFWMDTLVIPVWNESALGPDVTKTKLDLLKQKAIRQIFNVFKNSKFTVVIDNDLASVSPSADNHFHDAMRILASAWNRRLWTLQEAFLSKRLFIAFETSSGAQNPVMDLDKMLEESRWSDTDVMLSTKRHLWESLMLAERQRRLRPESSQTRPENADRLPNPVRMSSFEDIAIGYSLITNAWKASRWRTTSNPAHETLALATLLNLDYEKTGIDKAGLLKINITAPAPSGESIHHLDGLVKEFWDLMEKKYRGSIPAGLIFLPGEKVEIEGYGWAPRTFMKVSRTTYPDVFPAAQERTYYETSLSPNKLGLRVRYPGFLLHFQAAKRAREKILINTAILGRSSFCFPANGSLLEWYHVRPAEEEKRAGNVPNDLFGLVVDRDSDLAIILTRPDPKETPEEIGLLVEIYQHEVDGRAVSCCRILCRVLVKRDPSRNLFTRNGNSTAEPVEPPLVQLIPASLKPGVVDVEEDTICIGEALDASHEWYVDGPPRAQVEVPADSARDTPPPTKVQKLLRMITGSGSRFPTSTNPALPSESATGTGTTPPESGSVVGPVRRSNTSATGGAGSPSQYTVLSRAPTFRF